MLAALTERELAAKQRVWPVSRIPWVTRHRGYETVSHRLAKKDAGRFRGHSAAQATCSGEELGPFTERRRTARRSARESVHGDVDDFRPRL